MFVRYPAAVKAGVVDRRLLSQTDLFPTLLELAGLTSEQIGVDYELQGTSLLQEGPLREFVVAEFFGDSSRPEWTAAGNVDSACLLTGSERLLWMDTDGFTLYRKAAEGSREELVAEPDATLLGELRGKLESWRLRTPLREPGEMPVEYSDEERRRLEALGYLPESSE